MTSEKNNETWCHCCHQQKPAKILARVEQELQDYSLAMGIYFTLSHLGPVSLWAAHLTPLLARTRAMNQFQQAHCFKVCWRAIFSFPRAQHFLTLKPKNALRRWLRYLRLKQIFCLFWKTLPLVLYKYNSHWNPCSSTHKWRNNTLPQ